MIGGRRVLSVAVCAAIGFLTPSVTLAQHGPDRHRAGPPEQPHPLGYDSDREVTVSGTVVDVTTGRSLLGRIFGFHTLGLTHGRAPERRLVIQTATETVQIHLGPTAFLDQQNATIRKGDALDITGARVTVGTVDIVLAREVRKGDARWTLRDTAGQPLWSSEPEARGFWTAKKVLFMSIVAAKVAVLVLVGAHV